MNDFKKQAKELIEQIEKERGSATLNLGYLGRAWPSAKILLASPPEVRVEFVRQIVELFGKLGVRNGKQHGSTYWWYRKDVPEAAGWVVQHVLRKQLPFSDEVLIEMFEHLADMDCASFVPSVEQIVRLLEKRAQTGPLPKRLRKAAAKLADEMMLKNCPAERANYLGTSAKDRKLAGRIEGLLTGLLQLD